MATGVPFSVFGQLVVSHFHGRFVSLLRPIFHASLCPLFRMARRFRPNTPERDRLRLRDFPAGRRPTGSACSYYAPLYTTADIVAALIFVVRRMQRLMHIAHKVNQKHQRFAALHCRRILDRAA